MLTVNKIFLYNCLCLCLCLSPNAAQVEVPLAFHCNPSTGNCLTVTLAKTTPCILLTNRLPVEMLGSLQLHCDFLLALQWKHVNLYKTSKIHRIEYTPDLSEWSSISNRNRNHGVLFGSGGYSMVNRRKQTHRILTANKKLRHIFRKDDNVRNI